MVYYIGKKKSQTRGLKPMTFHPLNSSLLIECCSQIRYRKSLLSRLIFYYFITSNTHSTQTRLLALLMKICPSIPSCTHLLIECPLYLRSSSVALLPIFQCPSQCGTSSMKLCLSYSSRCDV